MNRPLFVTLEGLPCTGKTTVAGPLAAAMRAVRTPTVPDEYDALRKRFETHEDLDARFLYFLSAICTAGTEISHHLGAGRHVVVESYAARTVAFHRGMGSSVQVTLPDLVLPDVTFKLTCGEPERARRSSRGGHRHYWDSLAEDRAGGILREYRRHPMHVIDTTGSDPGNVVQAILAHSLNGGCDCENGQFVAGHPDLLSALPR